MSLTKVPTKRKPAETLHPVLDVIAERWSPRGFDDQTVAPEVLHSLFEAARWSASASNQQPWNFVYATIDDIEAHARFVETLAPFNEPWAKHAPVLVLVVAKLYEAPGKEQISYYDAGLAVGNLLAQATSEGLATHQMGGFDADKARELLGIPAGYTPLAMIAIGHHGGDERLSDYNREREYAPRTRKAQSEFVHQGKW